LKTADYCPDCCLPEETTTPGSNTTDNTTRNTAINTNTGSNCGVGRELDVDFDDVQNGSSGVKCVKKSNSIDTGLRNFQHQGDSRTVKVCMCQHKTSAGKSKLNGETSPSSAIMENGVDCEERGANSYSDSGGGGKNGAGMNGQEEGFLNNGEAVSLCSNHHHCHNGLSVSNGCVQCGMGEGCSDTNQNQTSETADCSSTKRCDKSNCSVKDATATVASLSIDSRETVASQSESSTKDENQTQKSSSIIDQSVQNGTESRLDNVDNSNDQPPTDGCGDGEEEIVVVEGAAVELRPNRKSITRRSTETGVISDAFRFLPAGTDSVFLPSDSAGGAAAALGQGHGHGCQGHHNMSLSAVVEEGETPRGSNAVQSAHVKDDLGSEAAAATQRRNNDTSLNGETEIDGSVSCNADSESPEDVFCRENSVPGTDACGDDACEGADSVTSSASNVKLRRPRLSKQDSMNEEDSGGESSDEDAGRSQAVVRDSHISRVACGIIFVQA
jgi:hypothetical protein